jgi:hypothetical protein
MYFLIYWFSDVYYFIPIRHCFTYFVVISILRNRLCLLFFDFSNGNMNEKYNTIELILLFMAPLFL